MAAQFLGAIVGTLSIQLLWRKHGEVIVKMPRYGSVNSVISEILGSFIYVLFFLVSTNK